MNQPDERSAREQTFAEILRGDLLTLISATELVAKNTADENLRYKLYRAINSVRDLFKIELNLTLPEDDQSVRIGRLQKETAFMNSSLERRERAQRALNRHRHRQGGSNQ